MVESLLTNAASSRVISTASHVNFKVLIWIRIKAIMKFLSFTSKLFVVGEVVMYLYSTISASHHDHLAMSNTFDLKDEHFTNTI